MHPQPANYLFIFFLALGGGQTASKGQRVAPVWGGFTFKQWWLATTWGDQPPQKNFHIFLSFFLNKKNILLLFF
jgi:hypothetical protein